MTEKEIKGLLLQPLYDKSASVRAPAPIKFTELYDFREFLGKGGFGQVVLATCIQTKIKVALKIV